MPRRNPLKSPLIESPGLETSISEVNQQAMERQGAQTLIDAMKYVPGAFIETRGRKVKQFFSVRGQTYPYPGYAIDGVWQREFSELPYFFSAAAIEKVEIIRSSNSLIQGISNTAGIINIVPKTYHRSTTSALVEYGTFNSFRSQLSHGNKVNKFSYALGMETNHTDGPRERYAAEKMSNMNIRIRWEPTSKLSLQLHAFHLTGERQVAQAVEPAAKRFINQQWAYDPYRASLGVLNANFHPNERLSTELSASYADREPVFEMIHPNNDSVSTMNTRDHELSINLMQSIKLSDNNYLRFGGLYNHWLAPNGKRFYVGSRNELSTYSALIVDEHQFNKLTVDSGIRLRKTHIGQLGRFIVNNKPGKGLPVITDEWEPMLYQATAGASYDFPSIFSIHFSGATGQVRPREGTLNTDLEPLNNEKRIKADLGIKTIVKERGELNLTGFYTNQNEVLIITKETGMVAGHEMALYENRDQFQYGLEMEAKTVMFDDHVQFFANGTMIASKKYQNNSWTENNEIPDYILNSGPYIQYKSFDVNFFGRYVSAFENSRFAADKKPKPLGNFVELNTTIGYQFANHFPGRLYFEIENITNNLFSTVVGYPDYGRRFKAGLSIKID